MAEFAPAYAALAKWEGGWVNHPADHGRETFAGISRPSHPDWRGWPRVDILRPGGKRAIDGDPQLRSLARDFFEAEFWQKFGFNSIGDQDLAHIVFDWTVMTSSKRSAAYAWVAMGKQGDPPALGAVVSEVAKRRDPEKVFYAFKKLREAHHRRRVAEEPSQAVFLTGWLRKNDAFTWHGKRGKSAGWIAVPILGTILIGLFAWKSFAQKESVPGQVPDFF
jgi:hypothetical protein